MTLQIVPLSKTTAAYLDALAPDVFDYVIDPVELQKFLDDPRHVMMLAIEEGAVVAMASAVEYFHPDKKPQLWINEISVTPEKRRRGIGKRLIEALVQDAARRGCIYVWVGTQPANTAAQATFASVGDAEAPQTFLLYEWDLED